MASNPEQMMKKILFILVLMLSQTIYAKNESSQVKKSLKALLGPIIQKPFKDSKALLGDFSIDKCEAQKINWMDVILMRGSAALNYKFKPGCDIEGTVVPAVIRPFPVDLKLKHLQDFHRLESENKIIPSIESKPLMNLEVRSARLSGKRGVVKFEADYAVRIDPMKKEDMVEENLGGEIRITEIYGKPVSIKEKIKIE